jgi:hypothetical protein
MLTSSKQLLDQARSLAVKAKEAPSEDLKRELASQAQSLVEQSDKLAALAKELAKKH